MRTRLRSFSRSVGQVVAPRPLSVGVAAAWVILVVGVGGSLAAQRAAASQSEREVRAEFDDQARNISSALATTLRRNADLTAAARAFLTTNPQASQDEFSTWFGAFGFDERYPSALTFGYLARVNHTDLAAYGATIANDPPADLPWDGAFDGPFAADATEHAFVRMGVARVGTSVPDLTAETDLFAAGLQPVLMDSAATDRFVAIPTVVGSAQAFFLAAPVYRGGLVPRDVAARRDAVVGWTAGLFDATSAMTDARGSGLASSLSIELTGTDLLGQPMPVGRIGPPTPADALRFQDRLGGDVGWLLRIAAPRGWGAHAARNSERVILWAGLAVTLLLFVLINVLARGRSRALDLVASKTDELRYQAVHDALTGLPNRALILDRVERMLTRSRRTGIPAVAMFIDLDGFKDVNDSLGHAAGDHLLRAVSGRLAATLRDSDTVGRLGGDEFVVLLDGDGAPVAPEFVAERILEVLRQPFAVEGLDRVELTVTASIGVAIGAPATAGELLRDADVALYEAKGQGKDRFVVFAPEMRTAVQERLDLEADLRSALQSKEFFLVYQPIFDLHSATTTGVEALLRWQHKTRGEVQPMQFIPLLEESGMIVEVGAWVLAEACRQAAVWHRSGMQLDVSVNVAARQLESDDLFDHVEAALRDSGIAASCLIIEITETGLMSDPDASARRLNRIKRLGVRIAIDDFGTGYSSLAYLRQLPVDSLKIDRSFISSVASSPEAQALIHTLVQLGKALGLATLAEGIEDQDQMLHLRREQCDSGQGYLYARPMRAEMVEEFVTGHVAAETAPPAALPEPTVERGPLRVVVVDDDPAVRLLVRYALDDADGLELVGEASDGQEAVDVARELRPDIILLDLSMPRMGGIQALPHLREVAPEADVLIMSGLEPAAMADRVISLGASHFLGKDFDAHELPALLLATGAGKRA